MSFMNASLILNKKKSTGISAFPVLLIRSLIYEMQKVCKLHFKHCQGYCLSFFTIVSIVVIATVSPVWS